MRYHDLLETRRSRRRTLAALRAPSSLGPEVMQDAPATKTVGLVIRLVPAVYRELSLRIGHGGPDGMIDIDDAWVRFPEPFDEEGEISQHCRNWIIEMVRDASMESGLSMCIVFERGTSECKADVIYVWNGDLVIGGRPPEGGLRL